MSIYADKRKTKTTPDGYELLMQDSGHLEYDFNWHLGPYWSKYIAEMRDNKRFMATKCAECGMVYVPPRALCGRCYKEMNEWVEVGPEGTLQGFTIVRFPYIDANNGELMKVPFTAVWIQLDAADTRMMHFCNEPDESTLTVGMRMKAVWADEPRPTSIHAVDHFNIVKEPRKAAKKPARKKAANKPVKKKAAVKKKVAGKAASRKRV